MKHVLVRSSPREPETRALKRRASFSAAPRLRVSARDEPLRLPADLPRLAATACLAVAACAGDSSRQVQDDVVLLEDVRILGTAESLATVLDVQPGPGDTVWVLNNVEPYFVAFSPEGEVVRAWGKRGGGPGEVQIPYGLVRGPDGDVWMFDDRRLGLTRISPPEGQRTESFSPTRCAS